jgi:hypothetical protein
MLGLFGWIKNQLRCSAVNSAKQELSRFCPLDILSCAGPSWPGAALPESWSLVSTQVQDSALTPFARIPFFSKTVMQNRKCQPFHKATAKVLPAAQTLAWMRYLP